MYETNTSFHVRGAAADSRTVGPGRAMIGLYLGTVILLIALGVTMVFSASGVAAGHDPKIGDTLFFYQRQLIFLGIGLLGLVTMALVDYHWLLRLARPLYVLTILLLIGVFVFGATVNNATRWIRIGPVSFQPSEFAKFAIVICAVAFAASRRLELSSFRGGFIPACLMIAPIAGLIIIQPDLGTAVFVAALGLAVLLVAGVRVRHVLLAGATALPLVVALMFFKFSHVQSRIAVWLDPTSDLRGKGHQIYQSLIAIGSGGPTGKGLGESTQKLYFLPEEHTDFIFSILVEELGLVGGAGLILLFVMLVWGGARISRHAPDLAGSLLAFGFTAAIALQAAMNLAVVTHAVPTKGISLPFISFGGTGLVIAMAGVGVVLNVARQSVPRSVAAALRTQSWDGRSSANLTLAPLHSGSAARLPATGRQIKTSSAVLPAVAVPTASAAIPRAGAISSMDLGEDDLVRTDDRPDDPMPECTVPVRALRRKLPTDQSVRIDVVDGPIGADAENPVVADSALAEAAAADLAVTSK